MMKVRSHGYPDSSLVASQAMIHLTDGNISASRRQQRPASNWSSNHCFHITDIHEIKQAEARSSNEGGVW